MHFFKTFLVRHEDMVGLCSAVAARASFALTSGLLYRVTDRVYIGQFDSAFQ